MCVWGGDLGLASTTTLTSVARRFRLFRLLLRPEGPTSLCSLLPLLGRGRLGFHFRSTGLGGGRWIVDRRRALDARRRCFLILAAAAAAAAGGGGLIRTGLLHASAYLSVRLPPILICVRPSFGSSSSTPGWHAGTGSSKRTAGRSRRAATQWKEGGVGMGWGGSRGVS